MNKSALDEHKMGYEDPHPKHVPVNPNNKPNKISRFFARTRRGIKSFFVNIKLAVKELVDTIM